MFTILSFFLCSQIQNMSQSASKKVRIWFKIKVKLALALQSNCAPLCPFYTFFSSRAVWAKSNNPTYFVQARAFRNDDDIILNFLVPPIFIQIYFCTNYHPPSIHFQFILSALGLFLAVKSFEPFEISTHSLRKIQFLAIFSSSSAQGEIIFPGC